MLALPSWIRPLASLRFALTALIVVLGVAGFVVSKAAIDSDRDAAAGRRAALASVRTQGLLGQARAYIIGLETVLAGEPQPTQDRFAALAASAAGGVGLNDALWVQESMRGGTIRLVATYTSRTVDELEPGADVSGWAALAAGIRDRSSVFAVSATPRATLAGRSGFYVLQAGRYGRGPASRGVLAVFVPRRWLLANVEDPRGVDVRLDGQPLADRALEDEAASSSFEALARRWRVDVTAAPPSGLQTTLPWLALAGPAAAAGLFFLISRASLRRRRAEREVERFFDMSRDLIAVCTFGGRLTRVNPAFEQTTGYSLEELVGRSFLEFVHPDDRERTRAEGAAIIRNDSARSYEHRLLHRDGSQRWIQWIGSADHQQQLMFGTGRDVTERRQLTEEQEALRRVATLVASGSTAEGVFAAVVAEIERLFAADATLLLRFEPDGRSTVVASQGSVAEPKSAVGTPVLVEGRVWGVVRVLSRSESLPADTEERVAKFTELVATAIGNAESRGELTASRARIVAASDETRRRIERDLHDGTQQRLVSLALALRAAEAEVPPELEEVRAKIAATASGLADAVDDLREISRGIHPAILSEGGLRPALKTLARRSAVPVDLELVGDRRMPEPVEAAAYFVVSEALANAAKHAQATVVRVAVDSRDSAVKIVVWDDGVGGADPTRGSGLIGLRDRVEALGGALEISSREGVGTALRAQVPIGS